MHLVLSLLLLLNWLSSPKVTDSETVGKGIHPSVATDPAGQVHVVYGAGNVIFYATSPDGERFEKPMRVDSLPGLHLGASRGPQIAATAKSVVITAIDKAGNIWAYTHKRGAGHWQQPVRVNDIADIAKEGFVSLAAGPNNVLNAVWLDLRSNKRNKIAGARSTDGGHTWAANRVLYESPGGTVCECCQLSIVSQGQHTAVMFRNFLNGSRDMYLIQSEDSGQTFGKAEKLGKGTWTLNACPMDGGGLFMTANGQISTVWRRADKLFTAQPGQPETELTAGKNPKIATTAKGNYIVFQQAGQVWVIRPGQPQPTSLGSGGFPKLTHLSNDQILCLWEQEGTVRAKII